MKTLQHFFAIKEDKNTSICGGSHALRLRRVRFKMLCLMVWQIWRGLIEVLFQTCVRIMTIVILVHGVRELEIISICKDMVVWPDIPGAMKSWWITDACHSITISTPGVLYSRKVGSSSILHILPDVCECFGLCVFAVESDKWNAILCSAFLWFGCFFDREYPSDWLLKLRFMIYNRISI